MNISKPINLSWALGIIKARGVIEPDRERLRELLGSASDDLKAMIRGALEEAERGTDEMAPLELIANLGRATSTRVSGTLARLGLSFSYDKMFRWLCEVPESNRMIILADQGDQGAIDTINRQFGTESLRSNGKDNGRKESGVVTDGSIAGRAEDRELGQTHHIYGAKSGVTIEIDRLAKAGERGRIWTIRIDAAKSLAPKNIDWKNKIIFQLGLAEVPSFTMFMSGRLESLRFEGHSGSPGKWLEIQKQEGGFLLKIAEKGRNIYVPGTLADMYYCSLMGLDVLKRNDDVSDAFVLFSLGAYAS